jgi:hypothetical protein
MQNHIAVQDLRQESKTHLDLDVIERQGLSWTHTLDWYRTKKNKRAETEPHARGSNREGRERRTNEGPDMVSGKGVDWVKVKEKCSIIFLPFPLPQTFTASPLVYEGRSSVRLVPEK